MAFTAFPVLLVAIFNRDVGASSSRRFPSLYASGQSNAKFNIPLLLLWLIKGILHAIVLFFIAFGSIMKDPSAGDGHTADFWVDFVFGSIVVQTCMISIGWF
jgi:phospholipid-transporting ATPase